MILVDSSVWIDYFNGNSIAETDFLDQILGVEMIVVGDIIFLEVLQGFKSENDFQKALKCLEAFPFRNMLGKEIALKSAINYRLLRKKGITPRKTIDMIIGTYCIENNIKLLYSDQDFDQLVKYLHLINALEA